MKRWFTETRNVDVETGESLSEARLKREKDMWILEGKSKTIQDCGVYNLKIHTNEYKRSRQVRIEF